MITKATRDYLRKIGQKGGEAGGREAHIRGGETAEEQHAYYARISKKGVRARAAKRRAKEA
jgi:hypothetical protein